MAKFTSKMEALKVTHAKMVEQGYRCVDRGGRCVYDNGKGARCAVGMHISAEREGVAQFIGDVGRLLHSIPEVADDLSIDGYSFDSFDGEPDQFDLSGFWTAVQVVHDLQTSWVKGAFDGPESFPIFLQLVQEQLVEQLADE